MQPIRDLNPAIVAKELWSHRLPEIFSQIVLGQHRKLCDGLFAIYFEQPSDFYRLLCRSLADFPYQNTVLPIHQSNSELFICYVPGVNLFIEHSIEWRAEDHRVVARSLAGYLDYEIERLCDSGVEPDELKCMGSILGHPDIDRIYKEYEASG